MITLLNRSIRLQKLFRRTCSSKTSHIPVMREDVLKLLSIQPNDILIDMTFGGGGHTKFILDSVPSCTIYCLDRDPVAHAKAIDLTKEYPGRIIPCLGKFSDLPRIMQDLKVKCNSIDAILFDFGCSSMQFDCPERGFALSHDGPLDMRMDKDTPFTAADVIDKLDEEDLIKIFKKYGEEKYSKKIARAIIDARYSFSPIKTTKDLANLVAAVISGTERTDMLQRPSHPATKVFQALRIFVNNELNEINYGMILSHKFLKIGGRLVTLSFHSLEDTIVKRHLSCNLMNDVINPLPLKYSSNMRAVNAEEMEEMQEKNWLSLTKHVMTPSKEEIDRNPRSRSAKLRAAVKIK